MRVHCMHYNKCSKCKKTFEYLVHKSCTWITEDQLRILLSLMLVAEPKGNYLHYECSLLEILRNGLLTEHILNSVFSPSFKPSTV